MLTTLQGLAPIICSGERWSACPRLCPARFENLRMEATCVGSQACVSDDGLASLAALGHTLCPKNGSDDSPQGTRTSRQHSSSNHIWFSIFNFPTNSSLLFLLLSNLPALAKTCQVTVSDWHIPSLLDIPHLPVSLWGWWAEVSFVTQVRWVLSALLLTSNISCHLPQQPSQRNPLLSPLGYKTVHVRAGLTQTICRSQNITITANCSDQFDDTCGRCAQRKLKCLFYFSAKYKSVFCSTQCHENREDRSSL